MATIRIDITGTAVQVIPELLNHAVQIARDAAGQHRTENVRIRARGATAAVVVTHPKPKTKGADARPRRG